MAIRDLCLRAGASCSTNSVQPGAYGVLGWVGAPLQQAPARCFLHSTCRGRQSQWQWEQYGNSNVFKALNSDLDYEHVLSGHWLLTQRNTSALPTQASVSAINVSDGRHTNNVLLVVEFFMFFFVVPSVELHCTQSSVCVYIFTL